MRISTFGKRALLANFLIWGVFIIISLSASLVDTSRAGINFPLENRFWGYLVGFLPWVLVTPAFYWFLQYHQQKKHISITTASFVLLILWSPFVVVIETSSYMLSRGIDDSSMYQVFISLPLFYWVYSLILFSVVLAACLSVLFYRRSNVNKMEALKANQANAELQLQLSEIRIKSLLSQLEPHFLFNSLNSIASLIRQTDQKQALTAVKRLSDLLRYAIEASTQKFVSFASELNFVNDYLALQKLRFDEKLLVKLSDKRQNLNQECPPFLLQIFVENAIKHGLEKFGEAMSLNISIEDKNGQLLVIVQNTHQDTTNKQSSTIKQKDPDHSKDLRPVQSLGIGLSNLRSRLDILYPKDYRLTNTKTDHYYIVELSIPILGGD